MLLLNDTRCGVLLVMRHQDLSRFWGVPRAPSRALGHDLPPRRRHGAGDARHVGVAGVEQTGAAVPHVEHQARELTARFEVVGGVAMAQDIILPWVLLIVARAAADAAEPPFEVGRRGDEVCVCGGGGAARAEPCGQRRVQLDMAGAACLGLG